MTTIAAPTTEPRGATEVPSNPIPSVRVAWVRRLASTPLLAKLVIADVTINVIALLIVSESPPDANVEIMVSALIVTLALNAALVYWALLPLRALETTTTRVSRGDLGARFSVPPFADRNIARIGRTMNDLLDHLTADRARARQLAAQVINVGDDERARIARELHDSTAQSLSALEMMLTAAIHEPSKGATLDRLHTMHDIAKQALSEVRTLSHTVHPRVLDDLGLVPALEQLARRTREQARLRVWVTTAEAAPLPRVVASALYRVAQEALSNAVRHAGARELFLALRTTERDVVLEVRDDGHGFDVAAAEASMRGLGLFSMRERLGLVDGTLTIASNSKGTIVQAIAPVRRPSVDLEQRHL
jgi:signal transduction histidine kinase